MILHNSSTCSLTLNGAGILTFISEDGITTIIDLNNIKKYKPKIIWI